MRTSTLVLLAGVAIFALPIPGTFILGALILVVGAGLRVLGGN
ncbi:hypothetical protein ACFPYI_02800 [Halomarina salina]|uniref:Transporter n=1 Tax=Halomarina salina TaxID=1872699 RepID=A0ABD5RIG2_9EURY|nr:hypothetical protein [Halomarina salina]